MRSKSPFHALLLIALLSLPSYGQTDRVEGKLITFNDNGAWCWYQDPRAIVDRTNNKMLIGSVASVEGPDGLQRAGNIELTSYDLTTGKSTVIVLHEKLEVDDHDTAALFIRPDGRYLAVYARHKTDSFSRWRISTKPHDANSWEPEHTFDWSKLTGRSNVTYSNLHYLPAEKRLYNFVRAINDDPTILVSDDDGSTWAFGGKLLTLPKIGYVNGYTRYVSNGVDRIDFITTDHHPRDFNNNIYHGFIKGGKLHKSDGTVVDDNVLDDQGHPQTELTRIFEAGTKIGDESMTRGWTADIRLDGKGNPVALITCRANDVPENSNFSDHRFFYARFDGKQWHTHYLAKAGASLWEAEQDYTGLGALDPRDPSRLFISTPIDPRTNSRLGMHEIFRGVTTDGGATWAWTPITENSSVDNLRPLMPAWDADHGALLWFKGTMTRSQHYNCAIVGIMVGSEN